MGVVICSHTLPAEVERWLERALADAGLPERIKRMFDVVWGVKVDYANILPYWQMERQIETYAWMRDVGRDAEPGESPWEIYGLEAESRTGEPVELPLLDIERAVPIIECSDYRGIWLDYRTEGAPRVVLGQPNPDGDPPELGRTWIVIADTFEDFLARYLPDEPPGTA